MKGKERKELWPNTQRPTHGEWRYIHSGEWWWLIDVGSSSGSPPSVQLLAHTGKKKKTFMFFYLFLFPSYSPPMLVFVDLSHVGSTNRTRSASIENVTLPGALLLCSFLSLRNRKKKKRFCLLFIRWIVCKEPVCVKCVRAAATAELLSCHLTARQKLRRLAFSAYTINKHIYRIFLFYFCLRRRKFTQTGGLKWRDIGFISRALADLLLFRLILDILGAWTLIGSASISSWSIVAWWFRLADDGIGRIVQTLPAFRSVALTRWMMTGQQLFASRRIEVFIELPSKSVVTRCYTLRSNHIYIYR